MELSILLLFVLLLPFLDCFKGKTIIKKSLHSILFANIKNNDNGNNKHLFKGFGKKPINVEEDSFIIDNNDNNNEKIEYHVSCFKKDEAKEKIRELFFNIRGEDIRGLSAYIDFMTAWLDRPSKSVKCYILANKEKPVSFVLLKKLDFDPLGRHKEPFMLEFIYTLTNERRKQHAYNLLSYLKGKEELSACYCSFSEDLFIKAKFNFDNNPIVCTFP